jgi:hypothetical protein
MNPVGEGAEGNAQIADHRKGTRLCGSAIVMLFCIATGAFHLPGLTSWFQHDDFGWLNLAHQIQQPGEWKEALLAPRAQGTIRIVGERLYFLAADRLFGLNAMFFHLISFLLLCGDFTLLWAVAGRMRLDRAFQIWALAFWATSGSLAPVLGWISLTPVVMSAGCFLAAFYLLQRFQETRRKSFLVGQAVIFVVGLLVSETMVIYPLLAITYVWFVERKIRASEFALAAGAMLFALLHFIIIPKPTTGPYALHWGSSMLKTLGIYLSLALGPGLLRAQQVLPEFAAYAIGGCMGLSLAAYSLLCLHRGKWLPLFGFLWFGITLLPVLPLRDHITDYYWAVPSIGLFLTGAWATADLRRMSPVARVSCVIVCILYIGTSMVGSWRATRWYRDEAESARRLVEAMVAADQRVQGRIILIDGLTPNVFWSGVYDRPFTLFGVRDVYLTPESRTRIQPRPGYLDQLAGFYLPENELNQALRECRAVVLSFDGRRASDITASYKALHARP